MLSCFPVTKTRHGAELGKSSHCIRYVWACAEHSIHQRSYEIDVWNALYFASFLGRDGRIIFDGFVASGKWCACRLAICHIVAVEHVDEILFLAETNASVLGIANNLD